MQRRGAGPTPPTCCASSASPVHDADARGRGRRPATRRADHRRAGGRDRRRATPPPRRGGDRRRRWCTDPRPDRPPPHLNALAATERSILCGPTIAADRGALTALHSARPTRIQHRGGALWIVNYVAAERLGLATDDHPGIERDTDGHPTGRLWRADDWLRRSGPPDLDTLTDRVRAAHRTGRAAAVHSVTREALVLLLAAFDDAGSLDPSSAPVYRSRCRVTLPTDRSIRGRSSAPPSIDARQPA